MGLCVYIYKNEGLYLPQVVKMIQLPSRSFTEQIVTHFFLLKISLFLKQVFTFYTSSIVFLCRLLWQNRALLPPPCLEVKGCITLTKYTCPTLYFLKTETNIQNSAYSLKLLKNSTEFSLLQPALYIWSCVLHISDISIQNVLHFQYLGNNYMCHLHAF